MIRVFEAFAGVGSQRMALNNLGIPHEVVAISEIDKFAIASYEAIHGKVNNLGDISKLEEKDIPDHDLFTYSFPCQDISLAGKQGGFEKGSGTRSSLLWECNRVIESKKPKYLLLENVKNLVGKKFKPDFDEWLNHLESLGYKNYYQVLNAKDYGIPQNRERVFVVSILGEHEPYKFPDPVELELRLKDVLEDEVDEKFYLSEELHNRFEYKGNFKNDIKLLGTTNPNATIGQRDIVYSVDGISGALTATDYKQPKQIGEITGWNREDMARVYSKDGLSPTLNTMQDGNRQPKVLIKNATKKTTDTVGTVEFPVIAASRGRNPENPSDRTVGSPTEQRLEINTKGISNTLTTVQKDNYVLEQSFRIRKLTPLECWRLMGFKDLHFYKAQEVNSNSQLYKQAGNSIVVQVLEAIFKVLLKESNK